MFLGAGPCDAHIGSGGKMRKVQMLLPGYIKGWKTGTELDREGFKHLMNIELRRKGDSGIKKRIEGGGWKGIRMQG
jgi:hypothetical protein